MEYIVGIDLCRDFTQLCIYNNETNTVDSVSLSSDRQSARVKTAISYSSAKKDFMVYSPLHDGKNDMTVIGNLYEVAVSGESVTIDGEVYSSARILARFFRRIISCINRECEAKDIKGITITVKDMDLGLKKNLEDALNYYGIPSERIRICDHLESFMYYVVMQNKDIWINDVGLMCFDEDGFNAYVLHFGRKQQPMSIVAESTDFSDSVKYSMLSEEDDIRIKYAFESVCGILLHKQNISALYATGDGFDGMWADETLKRISTGRRIFKGQNLYVKAAAYVSHLTFDGGCENYLIIGEDDLKSSIALRAVSERQSKEIFFGNVGQKYYEAGGSCEVILDNTNEIDFMIHNALKKDSFCAIMTLEALPVRRNKTNRVSIDVKFPSRDCAVVTVKDVGFGAIRKTDYRIWEQVINL